MTGPPNERAELARVPGSDDPTIAGATQDNLAAATTHFQRRKTAARPVEGVAKSLEQRLNPPRGVFCMLKNG